ncbi:MAG: manganese catalase family protein [Bacillota bacterium]|nr:manganese catalase family protein [Bacillota bacterium]
MWLYEKKLQYPVRVSKPDLKMAKYLFTQYGGPNGELSAAVRYLTQRYTMPTNRAKGVLTDIGTEELAHWEIVGTMIYKLMKGATPQEIRRADLGSYYAIWDGGIFPSDSNGVPWTSAYINSMGDPVANLHEDMAAEEKARATYEHLINLTDDPDLKDGLRFLRQREVAHFQRFGETLDHIQGYMQSKKLF